MSAPALSPDAAPRERPSATAAARRFRVDGMDCAWCACTVDKVVAGLDGVREVEVLFGNRMLLVAGDVPPETVRAAVRRAGCTAHLRGRRPEDGPPFWRSGARAFSVQAGNDGACGEDRVCSADRGEVRS